VVLTEISSETSLLPDPLSFSNSTNQEYSIGPFLEPEFIYTSAKYLYVKSASHRIEVLELATFTPCYTIEAKKAKCVIEIDDIAYVGCWDATIKIITRHLDHSEVETMFQRVISSSSTIRTKSDVRCFLEMNGVLLCGQNSGAVDIIDLRT
jgi:hypothetical protein